MISLNYVCPLCNFISEHREEGFHKTLKPGPFCWQRLPQNTLFVDRFVVGGVKVVFLFHQAVLLIVFSDTRLGSNALLESAALVKWGVIIDVSMPAFCMYSFVHCRKVSLETPAWGFSCDVSSPLSGFVRCRYALRYVTTQSACQNVTHLKLCVVCESLLLTFWSDRRSYIEPVLY